MRSPDLSSIVLVLIALSHTTSGGDVLFWMTTASRSHYQIFKPLAMALARRNHTITMVTPFPYADLEAMENVRYISVETDVGRYINSASIFDGGMALSNAEVIEAQTKSQEVLLAHPDIRSLMEESLHFDVTIIDSSLCWDLGLYLAHERFRSPVILYHPNLRKMNIHLAMGNPVNPAYLPAFFADYGQDMTFWERAYNTYLTLSEYVTQLHRERAMGDTLRRLLKLDSTPDITSMINDASFAFFNANPLFENVAPINPNTAWVGGTHLGSEEYGLEEELPGDVARFLDGAEDGAILVTFGTLLNASQLPKEKRTIFVDTFAKLQQRVIWKWEVDDGMVDMPENLMLKKWLPQQKILAHENLKLIITHGGLFSMQEALFYKVPMIVLPGSYDQMGNGARAERLGFGKVIKWPDLQERTLMQAIQSVLTSKTFQAKADYFGDLLIDTPLSSLDLAVYHTEYIMRHRGAPHLRSPAKDLNWFQYCLLDVLLFLVSVVAASIMLVLYAVKTVMSLRAKEASRSRKKFQ